MQLETEKTTAELLEQWAIWTRTGTGYDSVCPMFRGRIKRQGITPDITDDQAVEVDRILADLLKRDHQMGQVTIDYYMGGGNVLALARKHNITRQRADMLAKCGTTWVDCRLITVRELRAA